MNFDVYHSEEVLHNNFNVKLYTRLKHSPSTTKRSYIYFLQNFEGKIVYIGQSIYNPIFRVFHHKKQGKKEFSFYRDILVHKELKQDYLNDLEAELILKHKPKYNKVIPKNSKWANRKRIKSTLGINAWAIKRLEKSHVLKYIEFLGKKYYSMEFIKSIV